MGIFDKFTGKKTDKVVDAAKDQVSKHGDDIDAAIDKVADLADRATDGKHTDKIDEAAKKLKDAADKLDDQP